MAVAFVDDYIDGGGASETITLNGAGTNRLIFGNLGSKAGGVKSITDLTINAVSLSGLVQTDVDGGVAAMHAYAYLLDANHPGAGATTMSYTASDVISGNIYSAVELQGVDQTTPFGTAVSNTGTAVAEGGTVSCTLTGESGSFAIVWCYFADNSTSGGSITLPAQATLIGQQVVNGSGVLSIGYVSSVASASEQFDFDVSVDGASAADSVLVGAVAINAVGAADTTPPTYTVSPNVTATTSQGHTFAQTINEDGFVYGVRLASGASAPTPAQVKAGLDAAGSVAPEAQSASASSGVSVDLVFSGGAAATTYDYYFVAEDDAATRNIQAAVTAVTGQATSSGILAVSGDNVIVDAESPVAVTWSAGATGTSTPTINSITQSDYVITNDLNSSFEFVWPQTSYGTSVTLAIDSFSQSVTVIPQTGRSYVTLASYVEGSADITGTATLVDGDQLEYDSTDTNGNAVSISATGIVTITLASGQTEPGSFNVRAVSGGDRGPWKTIASDAVNLGPTISGDATPSVQSGNIFQVDYTIPNMDGQTPTITGADIASFTFTNTTGDIWRLESTSSLSVGTYNVTINANDGVNPAVQLAVVLTVSAVVIPGFSFSDLNPLTNSDSHPTSPGTVRSSETFTVDILEGIEEDRQLIGTRQVTTDGSGNLPDLLTDPDNPADFSLSIGTTYECALRATAGDGFVFERTATDVS